MSGPSGKGQLAQSPGETGEPRVAVGWRLATNGRKLMIDAALAGPRTMRREIGNGCDRMAGWPPADLVVRNARVHTVDRALPWAEAVAVSGGRITWVGADADAGDHVAAGTEVIDAGGRLVLPGFIDSHNHVRLGSDADCVLILLEHHWAVPLRDAIARAGGFRISDGFISPLDLVAIGAGVG